MRSEIIVKPVSAANGGPGVWIDAPGIGRVAEADAVLPVDYARGYAGVFLEASVSAERAEQTAAELIVAEGIPLEHRTGLASLCLHGRTPEGRDRLRRLAADLHDACDRAEGAGDNA